MKTLAFAALLAASSFGQNIVGNPPGNQYINQPPGTFLNVNRGSFAGFLVIPNGVGAPVNPTCRNGAIYLQTLAAPSPGKLWRCKELHWVPEAQASHGLSYTMSGGDFTQISYMTIPFACTIRSYNLLVDAGAITVQFLKAANRLPTAADSISNAGVSYSAGSPIHITDLSDFKTVNVSAFDVVAAQVTSQTSVKLMNVVLECVEQ
jgi:hypothetical protein